MLSAVFKEYIDATARDRERQRHAEMPDVIWTYDEKGNRLWGRPNYDKPGIREDVERSVNEAEWAANPPGGGLSLVMRLQRLNRLQRDFDKGER